MWCCWWRFSGEAAKRKQLRGECFVASSTPLCALVVNIFFVFLVYCSILEQDESHFHRILMAVHEWESCRPRGAVDELKYFRGAHEDAKQTNQHQHSAKGANILSEGKQITLMWRFYFIADRFEGETNWPGGHGVVIINSRLTLDAKVKTQRLLDIDFLALF